MNFSTAPLIAASRTLLLAPFPFKFRTPQAPLLSFYRLPRCSLGFSSFTCQSSIFPPLGGRCFPVKSVLSGTSSTVPDGPRSKDPPVWRGWDPISAPPPTRSFSLPPLLTTSPFAPGVFPHLPSSSDGPGWPTLSLSFFSTVQCQIDPVTCLGQVLTIGALSTVSDLFKDAMSG